MKWVILVLMWTMGLWAQAQLSEPKWLAGADGLGSKECGLWGVAAYPASLPGLTRSTIGVYGEKRFLTDLLLFDLAYAGKFGTLPFLVQAQREGNASLSRNQIGLAVGRKVDKRLDLGIRLGYHAAMAAGYPSVGQASAGIGCLFRCNDMLVIGFQADGVNRFFSPGVAGRAYKVRAGAGFALSSLFSFSVEALKEQDASLAVLLGIHYRFLEQASARIGYAGLHNSFVCSGGFVYKGMETELFTTYHLSLGLSAGVSLVYRFKAME
jgi:hypothetical protein